MHPRTTTTTETFNWQWPCGTACKMERQVTVSCCPPPSPHGCRCWHWHGATPPSSAGAGYHGQTQHHQLQLHQQEYALQGGGRATWALPAKESNNNPAAAAAAGRPRTPHHPPVAAGEPNNPAPAAGRRAALHAPVTAAEFWVPDPHLMVQQLREFECLNDEAVALRAQLQEYMPDIERSMKENNSTGSWFLALPENVRHVLVVARDAINSYSCVAMSTPPAK